MAGSALIHGAVIGVGRPRTVVPRPELARAGVRARVEATARPAVVGVERAELVARARADRAAGRLRLGEFLLEANALDARAEGRSFDRDRARSLYAERLERLEGVVAAGLRREIPEVFGDLHYFGHPGGRLGDALLAGGGSCEPLAHLLAAAIHDAGFPERAKLRYYGGESSGATHLAPVLLEGAREYDLLTGGPVPRRGKGGRPGVLMAASDLVDVYARAHGLLPQEAGGGGEGGSEEKDPAPSMAGGYPPNGDAYPGAIPLYAQRAVQTASERAEPALPEQAQAENCAFFVRLAVLDPPRLVVDPPAGEAFAVEVRRVPTPAEIDRTFTLIRATEESLALSGPPVPEEPADRAMDWACLVALYDRAATDLALASQPDLARTAIEKRRRAEDEGRKLLAGIDYASPRGARLLEQLSHAYAGRAWLLLLLQGGDEPVLRLARDARGYWDRVTTLAALIVAPATRPAALPILAALPRAAQIDVMHELFHAHDHARPWASSYAPQVARADEGREFFRAYRAFRAVAWGLWEAARPVSEVLDTLARRAAEEHLDGAWQASLLEYYGKNLLGLTQHRKNGPEVARELKRWLRTHGQTEHELYRVALAGVEEPT